MMLALRPGWLERPLGGLDQIYRTHKWAGILAVVFAAAHWLIEMGDDVIESIFGKAGKLHDQDYSGFIDTMRDAAEEVGEFAVYLLSHFSLNLSEILHKISAIKSEWGKQ
ncbi:MAG: ferric reductase-like transmembrane domain-containing protein [Marinobacter sp.]